MRKNDVALLASRNRRRLGEKTAARMIEETRVKAKAEGVPFGLDDFHDERTEKLLAGCPVFGTPFVLDSEEAFDGESVGRLTI